MSNSTFYARQEPSLELAWARTFLEMIEQPGRELAPFTMSIEASSGLTLPDTLTHPLAKALDASLKHETGQEIEKIALPLFPERLWRVSGGDRQEFYAEFLRNQPAYVGWEPQKNKGGMYFGRLIGFGIDHRTGKELGFKPSRTLAKEGNQLEHVIRQCKRSVELGRSVARMQLQATTFDPFRDLTTSGQPCFPCLQHIAFDPDIKAGGLALTAFYATQHLFVKAYGNWLGLCRLGAFLAGESGLKLTRFTCFASVEKMDIAPRGGRLRTDLIRAAEEVVGQAAGDGRLVAAHAG